MRSKWKSALFGLGVATLFLVMAFRGVEWKALLPYFQGLTLPQIFGFVSLNLAVLWSRGYRWWLLLPLPRQRGDLWGATRATILGYGVNNVASRAGELVRVLALRKSSGRSFTSLAAALVFDRVLLDFLIFAALCGYALYRFRAAIVSQFPQIDTALYLFLGTTFLAILTGGFVAWHPKKLKVLLVFLKVPRYPKLWLRLETQVEQFILGLSPFTRPTQVMMVLGVSLGVWALSVVYLQFSLTVYGVNLSLAQLLLCFTIASFGLLLPSPGGIGTVHYFTMIGLTQFFGVQEAQALAIATVSHGFTYLTTSAAALCVWRLS